MRVGLPGDCRDICGVEGQGWLGSQPAPGVSVQWPSTHPVLQYQLPCDATWRHLQYTSITDWSGGLYISPSMAGAWWGQRGGGRDGRPLIHAEQLRAMIGSLTREAERKERCTAIHAMSVKTPAPSSFTPTAKALALDTIAGSRPGALIATAWTAMVGLHGSKSSCNCDCNCLGCGGSAPFLYAKPTTGLNICAGGPWRGGLPAHHSQAHGGCAQVSTGQHRPHLMIMYMSASSPHQVEHGADQCKFADCKNASQAHPPTHAPCANP